MGIRGARVEQIRARQTKSVKSTQMRGRQNQSNQFKSAFIERWKLAMKWQPDDFVQINSNPLAFKGENWQWSGNLMIRAGGLQAWASLWIHSITAPRNSGCNQRPLDRNWQDVICDRVEWRRKWTKDPLDLQKEENGLRVNCHPDSRDTIHGKRLLLWRHMLLGVGYVDADLPCSP